MHYVGSMPQLEPPWRDAGEGSGHRSHLLRIPFHMREKIYEAANLLPSCRYWTCIDKLCYRDAPYNMQVYGYPINVFTGWKSPFFSLTLTCRLISAEVCKILYSNLEICIHYRHGEFPKAFKVLRSSTLSYLRKVTLQANFDSKSTGQSLEDQISDYQKVLDNIICHSHAETLEFTLLSNTTSVSLAKQLLESLGGVNTLRNCSISFDAIETDSDDLSIMVRDTALQAMGRDVAQQPFRFLDLPAEIQVHILEFTDLLTPWNGIEWMPDRGFRAYAISQHPHPHDASEEFDPVKEFMEEGPRITCRRFGITFSEHCKCWRPPTSLFLVCYTMWKLAWRVLLRNNRIIVHNDNNRLPWVGFHSCAGPSPPLRASYFLTQVIRDYMLPYIRDLRIVFPPFEGDYMLPSEQAFIDWIRLIRFLKERLNLPVLRLTIEFKDPNGALSGPYREDISDAGADSIIDTYRRVLYPLEMLKDGGLRRLHFELAMPWFWDYSHGDIDSTRDQVNQIVAKLQRELERDVMGMDYNSAIFDEMKTEESKRLNSILWNQIEFHRSAI